MTTDFKKIVQENKALLNSREYEVAYKHSLTDYPKLLNDNDESAAYMWFACGRTFKDISAITGHNEGVIIITSIYHNWHERKNKLIDNLKENGEEKAIESIVKDNLNSMLFMTLMVAQQDIQAVFMGTKEAKDCMFMPTNMAEMQKFVQMVMQANNLKNLLSAGGTSKTNISINNSNNTLNQDVNNGIPIKAYENQTDLLQAIIDDNNKKKCIREKADDKDVIDVEEDKD